MHRFCPGWGHLLSLLVSTFRVIASVNNILSEGVVVNFSGPQDTGNIALCDTILGGHSLVIIEELVANVILTWLATEVASSTLVEIGDQSDVLQLVTNAC